MARRSGSPGRIGAPAPYTVTKLPRRLKLKPRATYELVTCYGGAPVSLDTRDHILVAPKMAARISVIGIRQVATEHGPLLPVHQLPDAVWATENASVEVYAHDDHVIDAAVLQQGQQLFTVVGNGVAR